MQIFRHFLSMMFHEQERKLSMMRNILHDMSENIPDIVIVTKDGENINAQKLLLAFHSKYLSSLFDSVNPSSTISLMLPVSSSSIKVLLKILSDGVSDLEQKDQAEEVLEAAQLFEIPLNNSQVLDGSEEENEQQLTPYFEVIDEVFDKATEKIVFHYENLESFSSMSEALTSTPNEVIDTKNETTGEKFECPKCGEAFLLLRELHKHVNSGYCKLRKLKASNIFKRRRAQKTHDIGQNKYPNKKV